MIYALLLAASLAQAQEVSTTTPNIPLLNRIQISNLGKDTRALLQGRYVQTGKPEFKNGFCFGDGTCQTTAPAAVVGSSYSLVSVSGSSADASFKVCISTLSIRPTGTSVTIRGSGSASVTGPSRASLVVLQNGAFILGQSNTKGLLNQGEGSAGYNTVMSFEYDVTGLSAGTDYNFCIGAFVDSGATINIPGSLASIYQFSVRESGLR